MLCVSSHSAITSKENCSLSISTVDVVPACPKNEIELSNAKQRKRCDLLPNSQTCTEPNKFKYHCVFNTWTNGSVELCAPEIVSQGYCVKFDIGGARLQEIYRMDCTNFSKPCSTRFLSSDVLHYVQCTENITSRSNTENSIVNQNDSQVTECILINDENKETDKNTALIIGLTVLAVVLVIAVVFICYKYQRKKKNLAHLSIALKNQNKGENMELLDRLSDGQNGNQNMESALVSVNDQQNVVNLIQGSQDLANNETIKSIPDEPVDHTEPLDQSNIVGLSDNQKIESTQVSVGDRQNVDIRLPGLQDLANKEKIKGTRNEPVDNTEPLDQSNRDGQHVNQKKGSAQVNVGDRQNVAKFLPGLQDAAYNIQNFDMAMEKYHIGFSEKLKNHGVDCLKTFCSMTKEQFEKTGLNMGQVIKCICAADDIKKKQSDPN